ncbi:DUF3604 domain-containing protein [Defluviimonas sp. D31]|uniref:DUF3604 domain-containing protein n=1 Tax=Defluviimonas sp. D31 TaxID=3083253 RepID=UPI00296F931A|nr:DUF3604 domain-containing protein [Defluviimonas sp. D31]MDW4551280.1 DUF3604 domain-containing protein [Defluviimonas sp. D31]
MPKEDAIRYMFGVTALVWCLFHPAAAVAQDADVAAREAAVPENPLKSAFFGDTHVHTSFSLDAYIGGARLTPFDAYRFAKGEDVSINNVLRNIGRPLDFTAVSDHAEFLGEMYSTQIVDAPGHYQEALAELRGLKDIDQQRAWFLKYVVENNRSGKPEHPPFFAGPETSISAWKDVVIAAAQAHYDPGVFTALIGFEWTSAPNAANMHRNVIFRDAVVPNEPISGLDTTDEEKLWAWMAEQEAAGSTLLAIPHNSNGSKGQMFEPVDNSGNPLTADYAKNRAKWEPLIEMMQIKGNSEVVASLWSADEFADFENAPSVGSFSGGDFRKENFVRWAVTKGLDYQEKLGANPYKLGFIGGTDTHNGTPSDVDEATYNGSHGVADGTVGERRDGEIDGWVKGPEANPGSLAGVWATKNTRGAIWDAMAARESFVTSGPRIKPRFFGGAALAATEDPVALVETGYADGVPMGGTLTALDGPPSFNVHAMKDPEGANLDRIQIVKGWVDENGEPQDRVIDVVWSGDRQPGADGKLPAVGNTVDTATATYTNEIGAAELIGHWTDDDFDAAKAAVYYLRVIEIPTPRWTTYDAVRHGLPLLDTVPATLQERAWTSPIWYTPG